MIRKTMDRLREEQQGAALIIFALMLTVLIAMAAFMVDLGWLFYQGIEVQHGADAAALAGVIYEPDRPAVAKNAAVAAAMENGYRDSTAYGGSATVTPCDYVDLGCSVENQHQLSVTVSQPVGTFFMRFFGLNPVTVTKNAVAEYVLPLPLGSPDNRFGNDPANNDFPNFWGNIHGYFTGKGMGDRYSSQCLNWASGASCSGGAFNPEARPTVWTGDPATATGGYLYGVDVDDSTNLTVEVFDGQFNRGGGDPVLTGDQERGTAFGPTTVFILYSPDPTPLDTFDGNTPICTVVYSPQDWPAAWTVDGDGDGDYWDELTPLEKAGIWDSMCPGSLDQGPGIYPLRVFVINDGEEGLNRWSLRTSSTGSPRIYGLGDMAIYSNVDGALGNTVFYLAEVEEIHAGKSLVIDLWDPGDASGNHSLRIKDPNGATPPCVWTSTNPAYPGGTLASCDIPTSSARFNNYNVQIRVDLAAYTCGADCWWKIDYNYPGQTNDTTTWSARIEGNPVKLVK